MMRPLDWRMFGHYFTDARWRRLFRPRPRVRLARSIILVQGWRHQKNCCNASSHLCEVLSLIDREVAANHRAVTIGQPLLHNLVAADREVPGILGDVGPIGDIAQIHVVDSRTKFSGQVWSCAD